MNLFLSGADWNDSYDDLKFPDCLSESHIDGSDFILDSSESPAWDSLKALKAI